MMPTWPSGLLRNAGICHDRRRPGGVDVGRDTEDSLAIVVYREDGVWQSGVLPERVTDDLDGLVAVLRQQPGENGAIAVVNVADEFFVAVRVRGEEVRLLLSDVTAAVAWDLARQVVDRLGMEAPGDDDLGEVWPAGDMSIFFALCLGVVELRAAVGDLDADAEEMLLAVRPAPCVPNAYA